MQAKLTDTQVKMLDVSEMVPYASEAASYESKMVSYTSEAASDHTFRLGTLTTSQYWSLVTMVITVGQLHFNSSALHTTSHCRGSR